MSTSKISSNLASITLDDPELPFIDDTTSPASITSEVIDTFATQLIDLGHDYNILIVEFDKDKNPDFKSKFAAFRLHTMKRIFDCEDHVEALQNFVKKREDRIAKGRTPKASSLEKESKLLQELGEEVVAMIGDMMKLRTDLEGRKEYVYWKEKRAYRVIGTKQYGGSASFQLPAVVEEDESKITNTPLNTSMSSSNTERSLDTPSEETQPLAPLPGSSGSRTKVQPAKKRKRSATKARSEPAVKRPKRQSGKKSSEQSIQPKGESLPKRASKRVARNIGATVHPTPTAATTRSRRKVKGPEPEVVEEPDRIGLLDESNIADILEKFGARPTSSDQTNENYEIRNLKAKIEEQEGRIKEIGRHTTFLLKERDELRKDRQEAWDAVNDARKNLKDMTERKNGYKRMIRGAKRTRDVGDEDDTSEDSDSQEEIPSQVKRRPRMF